METGTIPIDDLSGGFDLQATVECGQSYCWEREDGRTYEDGIAHGGGQWYTTVVPTGTHEGVRAGEDGGRSGDGHADIDGGDTNAGYEVIRARQTNGALQWEGTTDARPYLTHLLGLDDDLEAILGNADDPLLRRATERYEGLRIVRDPPFPTLISFICSAQMRVLRIHWMQRAMAREFGARVRFDGETYHAFPTPDRLAAASEADLRELSLGYRAPYVKESADLVADGVRHPAEAKGKEYEDAREFLKRFVGVGNKVADCILLFSLGYLEAVPLDTWIRTAISEYYPDCERGSYAETSRAIREAFGGDYAGYVQTYVFYYLRTGGE
jgi:N-glycosylase/DNA lyase